MFCPLVGAAMCAASHDGHSVKVRGLIGTVQGGTPFVQVSLQTSHPAGFDPNHCPTFGTGELQEDGATLLRR